MCSVLDCTGPKTRQSSLYAISQSIHPAVIETRTTSQSFNHCFDNELLWEQAAARRRLSDCWYQVILVLIEAFTFETCFAVRRIMNDVNRDSERGGNCA